jgi:hypothetical protein
VIRQTIIYMRDHTIFESWGPPQLPSATTSAEPDAPEPDAPGLDAAGPVPQEP